MALNLGLGLALTRNKGVPVDRLIRRGDDGYAVDFVSGQMRVNFGSTPAKAFLGQFLNKLYVNGVLTPSADGVAIDATNFPRLAQADWPYNTAGITISGEIKLDASTDTSLRYIYNVAAGNNALAAFLPANSRKLTLYTGTGSAQFNTVATTDITGGVWFKFTLSAGPNGCFVALNGVVEASRADALSAGSVAYHGIGVAAGLAGNSASSNTLKGRVRNLVVLARAVEQGAAVVGLPFDVSPSVLACLGDSHTFNTSLGVAAAEFYATVTSNRLGRPWIARNCGISGDTTAGMLGRIATTIQPALPRIAVIYGGTNDVLADTTVAASPTPTSTVFTVASNITRYAAGAWITVAGEQAKILSIAGSQITLTAALAGGAPATGAAVKIATQKNLEEIVAYWQGQGVSRIALMGMHYWNFASGGDTTSSQASGQAALRALQAAAAAARGVPFVDLYEWMRQLILAGAYTQGNDLAWHVGVGNQHLNATGERIVSDALTATLVAQGWV